MFKSATAPNVLLSVSWVGDRLIPRILVAYEIFTVSKFIRLRMTLRTVLCSNQEQLQYVLLSVSWEGDRLIPLHVKFLPIIFA